MRRLAAAAALLLFTCAYVRVGARGSAPDTSAGVPGALPRAPTVFAEIDATVERAIAEKRIPGGVYHFEQDGRVYEKAYGNRALVPQVEPMTADTIFDAASLTKVVATTP